VYCKKVASDEWRVAREDTVPVARHSVPEWEETVYTPVVFVRVASKGVRAYGTWKSIRKTGEALVLGDRRDFLKDHRYPHTRVFLQKSSDLLENKRVEFL